MSDQTHPDSPSGQPYSAPTGEAQPSTFIGYQRETTPPTETPPPHPELDFPPPTYFGQAWGGNADPRNLSYEGARYFGPGYEQPNDVPWDGRPPQSYLPPPEGGVSCNCTENTIDGLNIDDLLAWELALRNAAHGHYAIKGAVVGYAVAHLDALRKSAKGEGPR